jgi:NTP pyrophosphatase (non-canonical NTP hydrolase)
VKEPDYAGEDMRIERQDAAAGVNFLAAWIGTWAERKGFREDWEDADQLDEFAEELVILSCSLHEPPGLEKHRLMASELHRIAESHRRMAHTTKLLLMVSEISEALEGQRDGGNYDEELADLIIRALENAHKRGADIGAIIVDKMHVNEGRPHKHGRSF